MRIPPWSKILLILIGIIATVTGGAIALFTYTTTTLLPPKNAASGITAEAPSVVEKAEKSAAPSPSLAPTPTPLPTVLPSPTASPSVLGDSTIQLSPLKLFLLINAHRENFNQPKLTFNQKLEASAHLKLADMLEKKYYRHSDPSDQSTWHFITTAGYQYSTAGENLAFNIGSEWEIFQAWVKSETHNKQMLNPQFTDVGIAIDCESITDPGYKCIVVAHFGKE